MNKHFIANKYLPIALALAAFTAAGTVPVFAQQSDSGASISARNAQPIVQKPIDQPPARSYRPLSVGRPDPFGVNGWFNR